MNTDKIYDLEERVGLFGESVIRLCAHIPHTTISRPLISQLIRSATSVGANYMEANGASSRNDFRNKIFISKKEIQETKHWLRMLCACQPNHQYAVASIQQEAHELTLIFQKISSSLIRE